MSNTDLSLAKKDNVSNQQEPGSKTVSEPDGLNKDVQGIIYNEAYNKLLPLKSFIVKGFKPKTELSSDDDIFKDYVRTLTDHNKICENCSKHEVFLGEQSVMDQVCLILKELANMEILAEAIKKVVKDKGIAVTDLTQEEFISQMYRYLVHCGVHIFWRIHLDCENVTEMERFLHNIFGICPELSNYNKLQEIMEEIGYV